MQIRSASNTNEVNWDDPLNKGLTAWYPFKQKGGNVLRDVVGDNHGTLESSMTGVDWVLSPETKSLALDFDRANDYVDCGTGTFGILPGSYEMTLSAWCKVRTFEDFPTILSKTSVAAPYGGWQLNVRSDSRFVFAFNQSGSWTPLGTSSEFSTNEWYLVTATRWKGGHSIFVNGTLEGQGSGYGTIEYSNAADPVLIGRNGARSETLDGQVSDVRIYNRALSESEVHDLYVASRTGYKDQFKRRYFPVSLPAEEPPTETTTSGLIRLKSPKQTQPSYKAGYAKSASESASPELWDGLRFCVVPRMGEAPLFNFGSDSIHELTNSGGRWSTSAEGATLDFEANASHYALASYPVPFQMAAPYTLLTFIDREETASGTDGFPFAFGSSVDNDPIVGFDFRTGNGHGGFIRDNAQNGPGAFGDTGQSTGSFALISHASNDHRTYHNGVQKGVATNSIGTTTVNRVCMGALYRSSDALHYDGDIAFCGYWDRVLTQDELSLLAADPLAPFRQRRYAPFSLTTEEPPVETATSGLIRLKSPKQTQPSYKAGYAKSASESASPELWDGLVGAWVPAMGPTGGTVMDLSGRGYDAPFTGTWDISEEGWQTRHESDDDAIMLEQTEFPALGGAGTVVLRVKTPPTLASFGTSHLGGQAAWAGNEAWQLAVSKADDNVAKLLYKHTGFSPTKAGPTISEDTVYSFAFTRYGSPGDWTVDTFVDGSKVSSNATASDPANSNTDGKLGHYASNTGSEWDGGIIAAMAYDRALSADEVALLNADPLAPFRQRRYAPVSLQTEEPTFNHWYALPGRIHRFIGLGVHV